MLFTKYNSKTDTFRRFACKNIEMIDVNANKESAKLSLKPKNIPTDKEVPSRRGKVSIHQEGVTGSNLEAANNVASKYTKEKSAELRTRSK